MLKKLTRSNFIELGLIVLCFILSIIVRWENLSNEVTAKRHFISGHSLLTTSIWHEEGFKKHGFNPVYTWEGKANAKSPALGGIIDEKGDSYYVSYPPFSFYLLYGFSLPFGGPSSFTLHLLSILIHLVCALGLYFIIKAFTGNWREFNLVATLCGVIYLLYHGPMWVHGNLYFADQVEQVFFIYLLFQALLFFKGQRFKFDLFIFGINVFLACYTEWLGVFTSFFIGVGFLILFFIQKKNYHLFVFMICAVVSSAAVGLTVYQYSQIKGWEAYQEAALNKYAERSGHGNEVGSAKEFNIHSEQGFDLLKKGWTQFLDTKETFYFSLIVLLLSILLITLFKKQKLVLNFKPALVLVAFAFLPIFLHYLVFFNFNAVHSFSGLKTASAIILFFGLCCSLALQNLQGKINVWWFLVPITVFIGIKIQHSIYYYNKMQLNDNYKSISELEKIKNNSPSSTMVFTNLESNPVYSYYAHHSLIPMDSLDLKSIIIYCRSFHTTHADYYRFEESKITYLLRYKYDRELVLVDSLQFD